MPRCSRRRSGQRIKTLKSNQIGLLNDESLARLFISCFLLFYAQYCSLNTFDGLINQMNLQKKILVHYFMSEQKQVSFLGFERQFLGQMMTQRIQRSSQTFDIIFRQKSELKFTNNNKIILNQRIISNPRT